MNAVSDREHTLGCQLHHRIHDLISNDLYSDKEVARALTRLAFNIDHEATIIITQMLEIEARGDCG